MKKLASIFAILISLNVMLAQKKSESFTKSPVGINQPKLIIKMAPLSLLNGYEGSSLRFGLEYRLTDKWYLYNEAGYFIRNKGALGKIELKRYIGEMFQEEKNYAERNYISFEFFYKYQNYRTSDSISISKVPIYYKEYDVRKSVGTLTVKYGTLFTYKCGLTLDVFFGGGIRLRNACNTLKEEENNNIKSTGDYSTNILTNVGGHYFYPNFDIGLKIGFGAK